MKNCIAIFGLIAFSLLASSYTVVDYHGKWQKLGSKKVSFKLDRDVIPVGIKDGRFNKLKLGVTGGSLNLHKMKVVYRNGEVENIAVKQNFAKRSDSRVIDLKGQNRIIKEIIFWYDTKNVSRNKATIHVFGRH